MSEDKAQPLIAHLGELRRRLFWAFVMFIGAFVVAYWRSDDIYNFLAQPLMKELAAYTDHPRMIYTALWEFFFTKVKIAFYTALCLSFPIFAMQIWKFVAPGLYKNERKAFLPFLYLTPVLFLAGAALVYYGIFPLAWKFFLGFQQAATQGDMVVTLEAKVGEYVSLALPLIFSFGLCFELPVVLVLLMRAGILSASFLAKKRKYAFLIILIVAAVITPPDVISQLALTIPIYILYEAAILWGRLIEKKRRLATALPS